LGTNSRASNPCYTAADVRRRPKERVRTGDAAPPAEKDKEANVDEHPLTDAQKAAIAEVRQVFTAKTAEREILHRAALRQAATREEVELLNENLRRDLARLASDRDRKIGEIRGKASP